jgi:hypothetical protein
MVTNDTFGSNGAAVGGDGGAGGAPGGSGGGGAAGPGGSGGSGGSGGALALIGLPTAAIQNLTIASNMAAAGGQAGPAATGGGSGTVGPDGTGGGLYATGTRTLIVNTLLASDSGGNCDVTSPALVDGGHNLSFGDASCPPTFLTANPLLGPLRYNGGLTQTFGLGAGSPAIDPPTPGEACPATDGRGVQRPPGPACDIGAYEVVPPALGAAPLLAVSPSGVTVGLTVTPYAGAATAVLQYGRGAALRSVSRSATLTGITPLRIRLTSGPLTQHSTYHLRVKVSAPDGVAVGREGSFSTNWPVVSKLAIRAAGATSRTAATAIGTSRGVTTLSAAGGVISYTDSQRASAALVVLRCAGIAVHAGRTLCAKPTKVAAVVHRDAATVNQVHLGRRFAGRPLAAGGYELQVTPAKGILTGPTASLPFRVR